VPQGFTRSLSGNVWLFDYAYIERNNPKGVVCPPAGA
jgi:hypothetical protein